ncbi:MAG: prtrc system protein e [Candidatus Pedobacter colombiensis]|uniref:Prtrc system protein e n=1 Tax=Candidatus Pedobacter colombiensis TaxID=3121371 RepID=A0AAJ5W5H0_9SPHI|nr:prtrc system protein e [Pedobacter sp.]WEK17945.1 MAG: prtrc system protein e [Pedobacter sp.]
METNFFQSLAALPAASNSEWVVVIKQLENKMIVSVLYKDETCGDSARKIIPTLNFNDSPIRLDTCFFPDLNTAFTGTFEIHSNMEHYLKQQEIAKLNAKMVKDKNKPVKAKTEGIAEENPKTERERKYEAAMKEADELEANGKHREAWMKVPEPSDYPEYADILRKRREDLSKVIFPPSLF